MPEPGSSPRVSFSEDVRSPPVSPPASGGLKLPFGNLMSSQSSGSGLLRKDEWNACTLQSVFSSLSLSQVKKIVFNVVLFFSVMDFQGFPFELALRQAAAVLAAMATARRYAPAEQHDGRGPGPAHERTGHRGTQRPAKTSATA